jgi:hypothetical protein
MTNKFIVQSISACQYYGDNKKLSGTVTLKHEGSEMKFEVKMNEEDCARIFEIFADRIAVTMGLAAAAVLEDVRPVAQLTSQIDKAVKEEGDELIPPDEKGDAHTEQAASKSSRWNSDDDIPF